MSAVIVIATFVGVVLVVCLITRIAQSWGDRR